MRSIPEILAEELSVAAWQVVRALALFDAGGTVPFVARYRKEQTGGLDEIHLRKIEERRRYLTEIADRRVVILTSIEEQGRLTEDLRRAIASCMSKTELEDLYLPFRPRRKTRASAAREKGLAPLAAWIMQQNTPEASATLDLDGKASKYVARDGTVASAEEAMSGASDILAEEIAETASYRSWLREYIHESGHFKSSIKAEYPEGSTQFEMYRDFSIPIRTIPAHTMLALRRGEAEGILNVSLVFDESIGLEYLARQVVRSGSTAVVESLHSTIADAFRRLMKHSLIGEVRLRKKEEADEASTNAFAANLRELLLSSPAGMRPSLGIDPGLRTGCKMAALDQTGRFLAHRTIFPHSGERQRREAERDLLDMVSRYGIELIAVGNGTAGRETLAFAREVLKDVHPDVTLVSVNESGASVYSAGPVAIDEFPNLDVTIRGAISIGRRLQDPLAELVKIDPKAIGVGQYQHDIDQTLLQRKLEETVESCVNFVGVDVNTASRELLRYVAGITPTVAGNIVAYRNQRGPFSAREDLLAVPRLGARAFEQAAGFLRIRNGKNPLDNTAVHPERYSVVERIAGDLGVPIPELTTSPQLLDHIQVSRYVSASIGLPTLKDILTELRKPGRDPRAEFKSARFREDVQHIGDLKTGMVLEGTVTNVADFGAFVDIGVHRDGLVHISQLADTFVKDPRSVVKVGQVVIVRVVDVDAGLNRISLSMRQENTGNPPPEVRKKRESNVNRYSVDDLINKFGKHT